jgi:hypothetical protein
VTTHESSFIAEQADKAWAYLSKGGKLERWFQSKDFTPAERAAILAELRRSLPSNPKRRPRKPRPVAPLLLPPPPADGGPV